MIHCVTTMNKAYYDGIGRVMIATWLEYFPSNYILHLYLEDFTLDIDDTRVIIEDWNSVNELFEIWKSTRFSDNSRHQKFTLKALTQIACWRKLKTEKLIWLDADTFSINKISEDFFDNIIEDYPLASWGSTQFESGTVFIDLSHPDFIDIKKGGFLWSANNSVSVDENFWKQKN